MQLFDTQKYGILFIWNLIRTILIIRKYSKYLYFILICLALH